MEEIRKVDKEDRSNWKAGDERQQFEGEMNG